MNLEEVKAIIKSNPTLSYEEMKEQANQAGVAFELFEQAWKDTHHSAAKSTVKRGFHFVSGLTDAHYLFALMISGIVCFELAIWLTYTSFGEILMLISVFSISTIVLFFLLKFFGSHVNFVKVIIASVVFAILNMIFGGSEGAFDYLLLPIIAFSVYYFLFGLTIGKSIIVGILHVIIMTVIIFCLIFVNQLLFG